MFGWNRGMGGFYGHGFGMGPGFGRGMFPAMPFSQLDEAEWLKRYKDGLELHKRDLEAEIKAVEERIKNLEK